MLNLRFTATFKRDYRRVKSQGKNLAKLEMILEALQRREDLPEAARDHSLGGAYRGHRECHIEPDWLLVYRVIKQELILELIRTGTHSDLF